MLFGSDARKDAAKAIAELMHSKKGWYPANKIIDNIRDQYEVPKGFVRQMLKMFVREDVLEETGEKLFEAYKYVAEDLEAGIHAVRKTFEGDELGQSQEVVEYFENYGFDSLVDNVAKQLNHEGQTVKELDIDRLYLGRYIDFLEHARKYLKWYKSDQAIARKRMKKLREANK